MPTLYLHVGPHKTGSTYLQSVFSSQKNTLQIQGLLYPSQGREYSLGHHNIAWFFSGRQLIKTTPGKLSENLSELASFNTQKILLSSEEFARIPESNLPNLKLAFQKSDFHILYFLRNGAGLVVSLWQEMVKHGVSTSMNKVNLSEISRFFNYNPFSHEENIAKFESQLNGTATVYNYNQLIAENKDLLSVITNTMGVTLKSKEKIVNQSMSIEIVELIRAANIYNFRIGKPRRSIPRKACFSMLKTVNGLWLKKYLIGKKNELSKKLNSNHFIDMGFAQVGFSGADLRKEYIYIPEDLLFDALNKDNIMPWRILKKKIEE